MKRAIAILLFLALCGTSRAAMFFFLETGPDYRRARREVFDRDELKPFRAEYSDITATRLVPLKLADIGKLFGPLLGTATNWWDSQLGKSGKHWGVKLEKYPTNLVVPIFAHDSMGIGGLHSTDPAQNKNHTDLHAIGDIGYVEFLYQHNGEDVYVPIVYFKADEKFVPLKTTNDFTARFEWEKAQFEKLNKWFDEHLLPVTDLGVVELSLGGSRNIDLGNDIVCTINIRVSIPGELTNRGVNILLSFNNTNEPIFKSVSREQESIGFAAGGKFFRVTPKLKQYK